MRSDVQLGKLFGIPIGLNYTWFLIFALVMFSLGSYYFPAYYPGWNAISYWIVGLITTLLFFASVIAHELAHSLVARATGIKVKNITLFVFGGVAQITQEATQPFYELVMAAVGPLSSLLLAGFFGLLWLLTYSWLVPVAALSRYLAGINLSLALFNMVPGFPLDGGRVFRAVVWGLTGSFQRATRIAATLGRVIGSLLIVVGLWQAIFNRQWDWLWLAFVGWFLESAATQSVRQIALRDALAGVRAGDVMGRECPQIPSGISIDQLVNEYVLPQGRRCFVVPSASGLGGLVTIHSIKDVPRERWKTTLVEEIMIPTDKLLVADVRDLAATVLERMAEADVNQMPVLDGGRLVGLISREHLLRFIQMRSELGI